MLKVIPFMPFFYLSVDIHNSHARNLSNQIVILFLSSVGDEFLYNQKVNCFVVALHTARRHTSSLPLLLQLCLLFVQLLCVVEVVLVKYDDFSHFAASPVFPSRVLSHSLDLLLQS